VGHEITFVMRKLCYSVTH